MLAVLAALEVLVVVAVPVAGAAFFAVVSFTGCFLECGEPSPVSGVPWASAGLALLALPVVVGVIVARTCAERVWPWIVELAVLAAIASALVLRRVG